MVHVLWEKTEENGSRMRWMKLSALHRGTEWWQTGWANIYRCLHQNDDVRILTSSVVPPLEGHHHRNGNEEMKADTILNRECHLRKGHKWHWRLTHYDKTGLNTLANPNEHYQQDYIPVICLTESLSSMLVIHCWDYLAATWGWIAILKTLVQDPTIQCNISPRDFWKERYFGLAEDKNGQHSTGTSWHSRQVTFTSFLVKPYASIVVSSRCCAWSSSENKKTRSTQCRLDRTVWLLAAVGIKTGIQNSHHTPCSKIMWHYSAEESGIEGLRTDDRGTRQKDGGANKLWW